MLPKIVFFIYIRAWRKKTKIITLFVLSHFSMPRVTLHVYLLRPNLGGISRILDKMHPISSIRHISQLN